MNTRACVFCSAVLIVGGEVSHYLERHAAPARVQMVARRREDDLQHHSNEERGEGPERETTAFAAGGGGATLAEADMNSWRPQAGHAVQQFTYGSKNPPPYPGKRDSFIVGEDHVFSTDHRHRIILYYLVSRDQREAHRDWFGKALTALQFTKGPIVAGLAGVVDQLSASCAVLLPLTDQAIQQAPASFGLAGLFDDEEKS